MRRLLIYPAGRALRVACGIIVTGALSINAPAQVPNSVGVVVVAVNSADPLRIVEFEPRPEAFKGPYIAVHNFSKKSVSGFRLSSVISAPGECVSEVPNPSASREETHHYSDRGFEQTDVSAGDTKRVYWNIVGPAHLVWQAKGLASSFIQVQLAVSEVEFSDGTTWKSSHEEGTYISDDDLQKSVPPRCEPWKQMNRALAGVTEVRSQPDVPAVHRPTLSLNRRTGFVFSCRIVGHTAICPTGQPTERV